MAEQLRCNPLCHTGQSAHPLLTGQVADGMLVLDDGALALWNAALSDEAIVNETDKTNHIEVLIILLKSTLEPQNLGRLPAVSVTSFVISSRFKRYSLMCSSW